MTYKLRYKYLKPAYVILLFGSILLISALAVSGNSTILLGNYHDTYYVARSVHVYSGTGLVYLCSGITLIAGSDRSRFSGIVRSFLQLLLIILPIILGLAMLIDNFYFKPRFPLYSATEFSDPTRSLLVIVFICLVMPLSIVNVLHVIYVKIYKNITRRDFQAKN